MTYTNTTSPSAPLAQGCHLECAFEGVDHNRDPLLVSSISDAGLSGEVINLVRNMGHQRAIAIGITYVAAHYNANVIVVMDCDGEDRPESVRPLLDSLRTGEVDAVVAQRERRSETLTFRTFYLVYRLLFRLMTGRPIEFGNFAALSMRSVKRLATMQELWIHMAGALIVSRLRVAKFATDRGKRYAGHSQMNIVSLALHGFRSMMVFAEDVLVRVAISCALLAALATALLGIAAILKITGHATPGWFTAATGTLILIVMHAGVMTFVTLLLSGFVRNSLPITRAQLEQLIDYVEKTKASSAALVRNVPS